MREIKFRGRQMDFPTGKDNGKWAFGYLVRQLDMGEYERWWITNDWDGVENFEVIPESIGQYTGLKDKNGKEIYEGDIVRIADRVTAVCRWGISHNGFNLKGITGGTYALQYRENGQINQKVIGNIYENPDLLEAK